MVGNNAMPRHVRDFTEENIYAILRERVLAVRFWGELIETESHEAVLTRNRRSTRSTNAFQGHDVIFGSVLRREIVLRVSYSTRAGNRAN